MSDDADILVVGAGLSGLLAAIALASEEPGAQCRVALLDRGDIGRVSDDGRATALAPSSLRLLQRLGVAIPPVGRMVGMRVGEGEADSPWQFELPAREAEPLALVVANHLLRTALLERLDALPVQRMDDAGVSALHVDGRASLTLADGRTLRAPLVVAADGADSAVRRLAGFTVSEHDFGQSALVLTVRHAEDHEGIALQRFQPVGAVASLPFHDPHRSQIVWSDRAASVAAAAQLAPTALASLIDARLWGALDVTGVEGAVQSFPLVARRTDRLTGERVALIGDAARTIHPLAGQGFNLAVRDVAALAETVSDARRTGQDLGTSGLIGYERWRRADETLLGTLTTLLSAAPRRNPATRLLGHLRRAAFAATDTVEALHPFIRREAASETGTRPPLLA